MKAVLLNEHGKADVLKVGEVQDPKPTENQVLVRLKSASINHLDMWIREGIPAYPVNLPHVLGADGSGVVEALGPEAEGVSEGDRVLVIPALSCGTCAYCLSGRDNQCDAFEILGAKHHGTYGEYVLVPDQNILPIPDDLSFEEAAAFPLAYLTAWHMLLTRAKLAANESVLVIGASAGVGIAAIQIAKWKGAKVLAITTNAEKEERLRKAGASDVLILKDKEFAKWIRKTTEGKGVDVVFEHVGPATWKSSIEGLARYGRLVTCGATSGPNVEMDLRYLFSRDLSILGAKMGTQKEFQDLASVVFSGKIKPVVDKVFPLKDAAEAHAYIENRKQVGKVLLRHND